MNTFDRIVDGTHAYIRNGNWTHYFKKDSVTGNMLAIMFPPSGPEVSAIENDISYAKLHARNDISVHKTLDSDFASNVSITQMPQYNTKIIILSEDELYTDGDNVYRVDATTAKVVGNINDFHNCTVEMQNIITNETKSISILSLHSANTPKMCAVLYKLYMKGNDTEKGYLKSAHMYNKQIRNLIDVGQLIHALNSGDAEFIDVLNQQIASNKHSYNGKINFPGDYFLNGDDIQYFVSLDKTDKYVIIETSLNSIGNLDLQEQTTLTVEQFANLIKNQLFGVAHNNNHILTLPEIMHVIVYTSLWGKSKKKQKTNQYPLWNISRYYYYN